MKKLLIGLLALSSVSVFAAPCTILISNLTADEVGKVRESLKGSQIRVDFNKVSDFGILASNRWVDTDEINPFGESVMKRQRKYSLYENGNLLVETKFSSSIEAMDEIITKLKSLRCE
ncbi:MAG: hypothetical protein N4A33_11285 [Bacteriovoracaceae bacterium]|jgi:hypothetical protein|nr:hypothetical protein [Bacteriovoracaceae bacterium]